jgi:hypothetical protein
MEFYRSSFCFGNIRVEYCNGGLWEFLSTTQIKLFYVCATDLLKTRKEKVMKSSELFSIRYGAVAQVLLHFIFRKCTYHEDFQDIQYLDFFLKQRKLIKLQFGPG